MLQNSLDLQASNLDVELPTLTKSDSRFHHWSVMNEPSLNSHQQNVIPDSKIRGDLLLWLYTLSCCTFSRKSVIDCELQVASLYASSLDFQVCKKVMQF